MKIAIITDSHAGVKNDADYLLDYQERFYKEVFFPYIIKNGISRVFHNGDFFDRRKYINFNTLYRIRRMFLDVLRELDIPMDIIPGNHDVYLKNTNAINSISLLMSEYKNIVQIHEPTCKEYGGVKFMWTPWINSENYHSTMKFIQENDADILIGHFELAGFEMYAGQKNETGMDYKLFEKFGTVWSGHYHHKSDLDNIHYLGSPMEFTFADCDDPRGFHVFDTETRKLEYIQNPLKLFEKIYYNDETKDLQDQFLNFDTSQFSGKIVKLVVLKKVCPAIFEIFVDKLYKENIIDLTIMEDMSEFHESNVDISIANQNTRNLIESYIDAAETDMNKDKLKNMFLGLYIEAENESSGDDA